MLIRSDTILFATALIDHDSLLSDMLFCVGVIFSVTPAHLEIFEYLLDYSRGLEHGQIPDYAELKGQFSELIEQAGGKDFEGPLKWSAVEISATKEHKDVEVVFSEDVSKSDNDLENGKDDGDESFTNSYFA